MTLVGQGGKIILFALPSLVLAIAAHLQAPQAAALPAAFGVLRPVGVLLLALGILLWGTALVQLLTGFAAGRLVTTGAYGIVRNPIYSSVTFFVLPAVTLLTQTWVYLVVSVFLYVGVTLFIGHEEAQLRQAFGAAYDEYLARVHRLIPLVKP